MKKVIQHLRKKPEKVRIHILNVAMVVCAVVLVSLWVYSLGVNLTDQTTRAQIENELKPWSALKANLVGGYDSLFLEDEGSTQ